MTKYQLQILLEQFQTNPRPGKVERRHLVQSLNVSDKRIEMWFRNERRRMKTKKRSLPKGEPMFSILETMYASIHTQAPTHPCTRKHANTHSMVINSLTCKKVHVHL